MTTDSEEEWRTIPGFDGWYDASSHGRIRSWRPVGQKGDGRYVRAVHPRVLKANQRPDGYVLVVLTRGGSKVKAVVHRLVALTFHGEPDPKTPDCCHCDGNPSNNRADNLRWDSRAGNMADRKLHGTDRAGVDNPAALLTEEKVLEIDAQLREGKLSQREIAAGAGVSTACVGHINTGMTWGAVTGRPNVRQRGVGKGGSTRKRGPRVKA